MGVLPRPNDGVDLNYFCKLSRCRKWWAHRDFSCSEVIVLFCAPLSPSGDAKANRMVNKIVLNRGRVS